MEFSFESTMYCKPAFKNSKLRCWSPCPDRAEAPQTALKSRIKVLDQSFQQQGTPSSQVASTCCLQIGNLQAVAQFLCNFSKSVSGTMADILSPARMVIFGTLLTTLNKPMFALSGWVFASFGTVATLYWITAGMQFNHLHHPSRERRLSPC